MNIIVAERILELMKEHNLNQMKLAEKLGVTQAAISNWLLKKKEPSIKSLWLLADYFDTDIDYIVGRKNY
ncbi:MAG: helix-turn-helix domain-containing protein [Corallococcus sp.]|nr:helix-turn-helix domain-containing protein [Corallococcus sp.]MCM1359752.1 helix-turn-helix domain-containing protein [Corallococcus sp.]MCM1395722.1 helix-turn-helix domain-containing protein [Corallococcus sp.]